MDDGLRFDADPDSGSGSGSDAGSDADPDSGSDAGSGSDPDGGEPGPAAELRATPRGFAAPGEAQRVIVKVRLANYVPDGFEVCTRVDDVLFTANASPEALDAAASDPAVESISTPRPLRPAD